MTDARGISVSAEVTLALIAPPPTPSASLSAATAGAPVQLSWGVVSADPAVTAYELRYQVIAWDATNWPESWTILAEPISAAETTFLHSGLDPDRRYRYQLRARNLAGASDWSQTFPVAGVQPQPGAPTLSAQTAASGSVALSWSVGPASTSSSRW